MIRFSVIGLNHGHIYGQVRTLLRAGAELAAYFAKEPEHCADFARAFPQARAVRCAEEILEDESIQLIASAAIPNERAPLGIAAMRHGKDFMADKPGAVTLEQLAAVRRTQAETKRIYSVYFNERFENRATVKAAELAHSGAIGRVVQTIGLAPHTLNAATRPAWFFRRDQNGGILIDIGAHQIDQFLHFTGSTKAEVRVSRIANYANPQYPEFDDFGDVMLTGNGGNGYARMDWFNPKGLGTWGDGRLIVLGTDGFIEVRKNCDVAGRAGDNHLFLVDQHETRYIDCRDVALNYGRQLVADVVDRTETAMSQQHCFLATELAIVAQTKAVRLQPSQEQHD